MSYNLTPIIIDLPKLKSLMGSGDTALLQMLIHKNREELLNIDALGEDDEEFEEEIKAEYKALAAGDFSGIDLAKTYPQKEDDGDDDQEQELAELLKGFKGDAAADPKAKAELLQKLGPMVQNLFGDDDDKEEPTDDEPAGRETSTGAALVHLILGGNQDPSCGYKYGYALKILCKDQGVVPDHDSWCSIRNASFEAVDAVLRKVGAKKFSTSEFFINRKLPLPIAKPEDFPFMGYLTRAEISRILPRVSADRIEPAIRTEEEDLRDWLRSAFSELRDWLDRAAKKGRDLIFFYS